MLAVLAAPAPAQQQFAELGRRHLPEDSDATAAVVFGDFDGDGDLDVITGNGGYPAQQNRLYLNDGTGTFTDATAARLPVASDDTNALVVGDIDGDGDLDLIAGNAYQQNRVLLNNGAGTFTDATAARMPVENDRAYALALGDVDGDGDLDLIAGNGVYPGEQNRLYLNNGSGVFTDATAARMPIDSDRTRSLALGDVDGDGDPDLIVGNHGQQNRLYLNNGSGFFTDATAGRMPFDNDSTHALALGDVDGDGDFDLTAGNGAFSGQQDRLYLNNGSGVFTDATAARMPLDNDDARAMALGDFDGDGDLDLIIGNTGNALNSGRQNRLYLNNGSGVFTDATAARMPMINDFTGALDLGDVDGDGDLDVITGNNYYGQQNRLYLNSGTGYFADASAARMPTDRDITNTLALGDVNGDGSPDLIVGNSGQQNRLYLNDRAGSFTDASAAHMPAVSDNTNALALGDVDGDGDLDLIIGNYGLRTRLYLNNGAGTFTDATAARMPGSSNNTTDLAVGDVDGDGDLDLIIGNYRQQSRLYLNTGSGSFVDATAGRMPVGNNQTLVLALGDVDGDGDLDLIAGNMLQQDRLYLNNGTAIFTDATAARMPGINDWTRALALGDIDGDGDLDLIAGNYAGQRNRIYLNSGTGFFTDVTAARMPVVNDATRAMALGDVDGDGDLDLIVGTYQQDRLYLNNGAGSFTDATVARMPVESDFPRDMVLGDVDGDGDLDLAVGHGGPRNRLYLNLLRQLDAPLLLRPGYTWRLDAYARNGPIAQSGVAVPFLSFARASIPLPPFGTIGIDPNLSITLPSVLIPQPAGVGSLSLPIPVVPGIAGIPTYTQALLLQPPGQPWLTNVVADVIVR